jgi:hypothetical protein
VLLRRRYGLSEFRQLIAGSPSAVKPSLSGETSRSPSSMTFSLGRLAEVNCLAYGDRAASSQVAAEKRQTGSSVVGDEDRAAGDERHGEPIRHRHPLAEKNHTEQNDTELVERSDPRRVPELP